MQKTLIGDVVNDETDLIAVPGQHNSRRSGCVSNTEHIAHHVGANIIRPWSYSIPDQFLHLVFVTRRAGRFDELFEELFAIGIHEVGSCRPTLLKRGALTTAFLMRAQITNGKEAEGAPRTVRRLARMKFAPFASDFVTVTKPMFSRS